MSDWLFLCGILSGITTWLFGFGGGFVTVPLLYLLATSGWGAQSAVGQQAMQIAVATSALVMLCSALLATWRHARTGILRWRRLWAILTGIAVGGTAGAMLALQVNGEWIRWLFVIYLLATIIDCYLRHQKYINRRQSTSFFMPKIRATQGFTRFSPQLKST